MSQQHSLAIDVSQLNEHEIVINDFYKLVTVLINSVNEKHISVKCQIY